MDKCGFNRLDLFYFKKEKDRLPNMMVVYRRKDAYSEYELEKMELNPKVTMPVPEEMTKEGVANGK
jgi:hypothetical protein